MAKRPCQATTKNGKPCRANPLKGKDLCLSHDQEAKEAVRFGGAQPGAGRPRRPREIELIQQVAEEFKDQLRQVYIDGLLAERGVVVGDGPAAHVEFMADHGHRLKTAQEIQDRLHGKPRQAVEHSGPEGSSLAVDLVLDETAREALANVLRRRPAARGE